MIDNSCRCSACGSNLYDQSELLKLGGVLQINMHSLLNNGSTFVDYICSCGHNGPIKITAEVADKNPRNRW